MTRFEADKARIITLAAEIVSAYVSNNHVQSGDLPKLLQDVHDAIRAAAQAAQPVEAPTKPTAQEIKRSVTPDFLVSFEDGKPYKTLRRHLTLRGLTPEAYRAKWGLDLDYPMTAQSYSEQRSALARSLGLGQQRRRVADEAGEAAVEPSEPEPAKRRRAKRKEDA
ncbi:MucR family transcriptional regulator [Methylobacterium sp. NEAU 140]|uniref:MucR family transcriptional regulator n=1 Tax=Methylobacterium sp. NEAU 140 TaxID=3064945 RepID=UPI0027377AC5|nr:MucR family transcriptional regulator [Methylobacterium sp. NEAU 140]MDP4023770.1 MucR family transcriptional regulator [Methylobacterium sp. NEAU 140]